MEKEQFDYFKMIEYLKLSRWLLKNIERHFQEKIRYRMRVLEDLTELRELTDIVLKQIIDDK